MKNFFCILSMFLLFTGCLKRDEFENVTIYTSNYPVKYITERLYGENSTISSIYPNGTDINTYELNAKQIQDYSSGNLFIFNGLIEKEKEYVINMFDKNKNLKIIDSSLSMEYTNDIEELWLNPTNFLMIAQNITTGLSEYISNHYIIEEIEENYNSLKLEVSEIDANLKLMGESSNKKLMVVSSDLFKFLEKYGITVVSLEENENLNEKIINDVTSYIQNGDIEYIYLKQGEKTSDTIQKIIDQTGVKTLYIHTLSTITDEEENNEKDYISIMNENISLFKQELYD